VKLFHEDSSRLRYLTREEYDRLIEAARTIKTSPYLEEKIVLAAHTGLRRGSLFNLRWDQVDFANRVMRIPRTKSGRPLSLPLNATALQTLKALASPRQQRTPTCSRTGLALTPERPSGRRRSSRPKSGCSTRLHQSRRRRQASQNRKGQERGNRISREIPPRRKCQILLRKVAPQVGFEPTTLRLTGGKRNVSRRLRPCAGRGRIARNHP
jgi:integrase